MFTHLEGGWEGEEVQSAMGGTFLSDIAERKVAERQYAEYAPDIANLYHLGKQRWHAAASAIVSGAAEACSSDPSTNLGRVYTLHSPYINSTGHLPR
jgi:hypothetical protein